MIPKQIKELILEKDGKEKVFKTYLKTFELVDKYADDLEGKDLFTEYELKDAQQKLTGAYVKLYVVGITADTMKINSELNYYDREVARLNKEKQKVNVSQLKEQGRAQSNDLREIRNTFSSYADACEKAIITCQSLLKRQTNEKGAKGVDFTGGQTEETPKSSWDN